MMDSDLIIAVVGTISVFSIPIVAILTHHQRKMAEIIHGTRAKQASESTDALAVEIRELRQTLNQQTIAMDSLSTEVRKAVNASPDTLSGRLSRDQSLSQ